MKREPLQVCVRVLCALVPSLLLTLGGSVPCFGGVIASSNFNSGSSQDSLPAVSWNPTLTLGSGVPAANSYAALVANSGAVDTTNNNGGTGPFAAGARSTSLQLHVNFTNATGSTWTGSASTPILAVSNTESALNRLNVSFDMSPSLTLPVRFRIESFSSTSNTPTGALEGLLIPSSYYSFYRYSVDLDTLYVPTGAPRAFVPTGTSGKRVRFTFYLDGGTGSAARWPKGDNNTIAIDNICYTSPTRWVAPGGNPDVDGTSYGTPTTVLHAYNLVQAGDVICFQAGTYNNPPGFQNHGTPSRWITLRAAPGATPVLTGTGWSVLGVAGGSAYVDIRGFTVQGIYDENNATNAANLVRDALADGALLNTYRGQEYNPAYIVYYDDPFGRASNINGGNSYYNTNGIYINGNQKWDGSAVVNTAKNEGIHHVRIADNIVKDMPAAGIGVAKADYVYIENNVVKETSHLSRYATSGITIISNLNFDGNAETKVFVTGNECARNRGDVPWTIIGGGGDNHQVKLAFSDGNGIIIDINRNVDIGDTDLPYYQGRTLVQNNVCYENGGSGIHTVGASFVDIVNNTTFNNNQPNQATGTINKVTYTQTSPTANSYPVANYSTDMAAQNSAGTRLGYGQLFAGYASRDVHLFNNVAWAPDGCDVNAVFPGDGGKITYNNNVFGRYGADGGVYSTGFTNYYNNNVVSSDPLKIFTSVTVGDRTFLRLQGGSPTYPSSPAIDAGVIDQGAPFLDFDGDFRPVGSAIDAGAFEVDY